MPDWSKSMQQTFECYIVDPTSWKDKASIKTFKSAIIERENSSETLGSASISVAEDVGECYVRNYLITNQNGIRERFPLGTFLVQTTPSSFDGRVKTISVDAYTPLLELKENKVPTGYYVPKNTNVMDAVYMIVKDNVRAPVVKPSSNVTLIEDFVANGDDTWLSFCEDLAAYAKFELDLNEEGQILFAPKQDIASLQPVTTYTDDNSSILYPDLSMDYDLYGIPNVVEVSYSGDLGIYFSRAVNDDPDSALSVINRGREIIHQITSPSISGNPTQEQIDEYAEQTLRDLSSLDYTITYKHAFNNTRVNDCVRLNYEKAGLNNVKAKVISQSIECTPGCMVTEKAIFTRKLWEVGPNELA